MCEVLPEDPPAMTIVGEPSPKSHFHEFAPLLLSMKDTESGANPDVGDAEKDAVIADAEPIRQQSNARARIIFISIRLHLFPHMLCTVLLYTYHFPHTCGRFRFVPAYSVVRVCTVLPRFSAGGNPGLRLVCT